MLEFVGENAINVYFSKKKVVIDTQSLKFLGASNCKRNVISGNETLQLT